MNGRWDATGLSQQFIHGFSGISCRKETAQLRGPMVISDDPPPRPVAKIVVFVQHNLIHYIQSTGVSKAHSNLDVPTVTSVSKMRPDLVHLDTDTM